MKKLLIVGSVLALAVVFFGAGSAVGQDTEDQVVLKARHHLGVPLHSQVGGSNTFQRVPDGALAGVIATAEEGRWLMIRLADGNEGWISKRYVGEVLPGPQPTPTPQPGTGVEAQVWVSPEGCQAALAAGERMPSSLPDSIRAATWNIRWYPKGCSQGEDCPENETDNEWLACTIAWMDLDVLAVQEILDDPVAQFRTAELTAELDTLTGGSWDVDLQECGPEKAQHVGFLWNSDRVTLSDFADAAQLNGAFGGGSACASNLRPGRYARAETPAGTDFHILSVHFDSGVRDRDYQNRRAASEQIPFLRVDDVPLLDDDPDVLVVGDFNTIQRTIFSVGRSEPPEITAEQEIVLLDGEIGPEFRRVDMTPNCTEFFDNRPGVLDHITVTSGMQEAAATARVSGYCAVRECADFSGALPAAYERLSDHCPVVFEIRDEDLDSQ
jgi:endonuclease/exonuclease/phosphatase family metal-dependent hydrolase